MKTKTVCMLTAALAATCLVTGGALMCAPVLASANTAEETPQAASEIEIVETLTWEGTPTAGWGQVLKNEHCSGGPLTVAGVTYTRNSIGSHLPVSGTQDIVYDITDYSEAYPYFTMEVAQPDGANNSVWFSVLADDVVVDRIQWEHAQGGDNNTRTPSVMRAYVKGAKKLTLRIECAKDAYNDGAVAFLNVRLQKETIGDGYVYANRILDRVNNATDGGYNSGYGLSVLYDRQNNNTVYDFPIYADHLIYGEGLGIHLRNVPYETYSADKTNTDHYISYKWDIKDYSFSYFSALAYQQSGFGFHVDIWADGVEIDTSGHINSVDTYVATGVDPKTAPQEISSYIPDGTKELEVRIIADTAWDNGMVNLMAPTFFVKNDNLVSRAAEQTAAYVWPFEAVRGRMWNGDQATYYDATAGTNVEVTDGIFFVAGIESATAGKYVFDLGGETKNSLIGTLGRAPYYPDHAEAKPVSLVAEVAYEDGSVVTTRTEGVDWSNSGLLCDIAHWETGAKTLTLWLYSDNPSFSETVLTGATFVDRYSVTFNDGTNTAQALYEPNAALSAPEAPEAKTGYTFGGWALQGESAAYDFTNKTVTADMQFVAIWTANAYAITYQQQLGDGTATAETYLPAVHTYGTDTQLPVPKTVIGYTFDGWYVNGQKVTALDAEGYTVAITAVAKYTVNSFTVTFKDGESTAGTEKVDYGKTVANIPVMQKTGYAFTGWTDGDGTGFSATAAITEDVTVFANWEALTYTVTYRHLIGAAEQATEGYTPAVHTYGTDTELPAAQAVEGYTFDGWYVNDQKVTVLGGEAFLENITVIGKYSINTCTVTFTVDGETAKVSYDYGMKISQRTAEKEGYVFKGWYTDEACTQAFDSETALTADITLYAGFEKESGCGSVVFGGIGMAFVALGAGVVALSRKRKN